MDQILFASLSILLYLGVTVWQTLSLRGWVKLPQAVLLTLGLVALCLHALLLHRWIDISAGQNLNFFNLFSLAAWLVAVIILVMILIRPLQLLILFVFPVAALSILFIFAFPGQHIVHAGAHPDTLFHILLAVLTFCVLSVAGLLAVLLALQEYLLRRRTVSGLMKYLPPLETMEVLLFQMIGFGFILLSVVLVTSLYFYYPMVWQQMDLLQKAILTFFAWLIFAVLLWGRYQWGWRGRKAIYCTLFGVLLLVLVYFGDKLLMDVLY